MLYDDQNDLKSLMLQNSYFMHIYLLINIKNGQINTPWKAKKTFHQALHLLDTSYICFDSLCFENSEKPESIHSLHLLILLQSRKKGRLITTQN